ncbi:hypothetical protein EHQ58_11035 [Leptospira ognonensis]|uniref:Lipoprotein n=1 Tax=Leptospira ognonensis TaxID=2484945 RepID=A0A4R9JZ22_9LEPT|nr:hypothetical protein [Leptospira ognonensis]TGL57929.1 hypothetical protein EHQ58_11035 [Leptospira ognonensis]
MKERYILALFLAISFACKPGQSDSNDLVRLLLVSDLFGNQINLQLDRQGSVISTRASSDTLSSLPEKFKDGRPTQVVPAKNFRLDLLRIFLWKSKAMGGVEYGKETIANADVTILDMGAQGTGAEASGKVAYGVFEGNILQNSYAYGDFDGNVVTQWSVSEQWKDGSYDRIGLELSEIVFEYDMARLSSKASRVVSLEVKGIATPNNAVSSMDRYVQAKAVPVMYVLSYPSKYNTETDTPCSDRNPNFVSTVSGSQNLRCTGVDVDRFYVDARTGGPSLGNPFYFRSFASNLTNVPNFTAAEYDRFATDALPYPRVPIDIKSHFLNWETPTNTAEYENEIWKTERVILLKLPNASNKRKKININIDASVSFVYQTAATDAKFERNEVPTFNYPALSASDLSVKLDSTWLTAYGNDYSAWSYAPKNGNQPDPTNGRDFGYFLPKFSVTAE